MYFNLQVQEKNFIRHLDNELSQAVDQNWKNFNIQKKQIQDA